MAHTCIEHPHEQAEGLCRKCGAPFCPDCLVYPFGPAKPPYCIPCAVAASGVRTNAANPTIVVPKETKRRLKEWRKARKHDLESPPPDGVATWQRMDEVDTEEDKAEAEAQAAAEREALRLPPPAPETPTPPPGVNLAPPGPPGEDWRSGLNFGPPGSSLDEPGGEQLLGFLADDEPPKPFLEPPPLPADRIDAPPPDDDHFGMGATSGADPFAPVGEPRPLNVPDLETMAEPAPYAPSGFAALDDPDPAAYEPSITTAEPYAPSGFAALPDDEPASPVTSGFAVDRPAYEPDPFESGFADLPVSFDPDPDPLVASFGPSPAEPVGTASAPASAPYAPAASLDAFGLAEVETPMPFLDDPVPPPPPPVMPVVSTPPPAEQRTVDATPAARAAGTDGLTTAMPTLEPETFPARRVTPDIPSSAIRPPTPTRIPAARSEPAAKTGDAKAMLARIAALRSDKD